MKKLFVCLLFSALFFIGCQTAQVDPNFLNKYSVTIEGLNQSQDSLFVSANIWMVDLFNSSKDVMQYQDKAAGIITGKAIVTVDFLKSRGYQQPLFVTFVIDVKKDKCKITFRDMRFQYVQDSCCLHGMSQSGDFGTIDMPDFKRWADLTAKDLENKFKIYQRDKL